jgi:octaprenyl-diphosphate synthase
MDMEPLVEAMEHKHEIAESVIALEGAARFTVAVRAGDPGWEAPRQDALVRLAEVRRLLEHDMGWVEQELGRAVGEGLEPATSSAQHLFEAGGKRIRPLAVLLGAACFGEIGQAARELAVVAELVHLATLLHDDVVDDGDERRGIVTARRVWGNAVSVLAGDLLLTHALGRTTAVAPHPILVDLVRTLRLLVDGEVVQLRGRTKLEANEALYFRIVEHKTGALFGWAMRAGAATANAPSASVDALSAFGEHVGVAFQLVDDVLDYVGDPETTGKALLVDLHEGKLTLPLLRALARGAADAGDVEGCRRGDRAAATRLANAVRASGACDDVRALARERTKAGLAALERVPVSYARSLLAEIARSLTERAA